MQTDACGARISVTKVEGNRRKEEKNDISGEMQICKAILLNELVLPSTAHKRTGN